jgi:putative serine protease PepD
VSLARRVVAALTGLVLIPVLAAACSAPIRLATPNEIKQAAAPTPSPASPNTTIPIAPSPGASPGAGVAPGASPAPAPAGSGALAALQAELRALVDQVLPSVVQIDTPDGSGSGVVIDATGDIVTNAHVVGSNTSFTVTTSAGQAMSATLVGTYASGDLALIRAAVGDTSLKPITIGDSNAVHVGDIVLAIGSPLGLTDSVSEGVVSGLNRAQPESSTVMLTGLIQTTAAINPGNSGGALVDISGHLVGIPTLGASAAPRSGAATGIGFAIPSAQVSTVTKQLAGGGAVTHTGVAYLGIVSSDVTTGTGVNVNSASAGGPADQAGVKAGWIITNLAGHPITDTASLSQALSTLKPGARVALTARLPDGSTRTVTVTLGERPATP